MGSVKIIVRRLLLPLMLVALATAFIVPVASAAQPVKTTEPFSGSVSFAAGDLCDFNYQLSFSGTDESTTFGDGRREVHRHVVVVHTNLDTNYAVTDSDSFKFTYETDGTLKVVGQSWHGRDATGKLVIHQSGLTIYTDPSGFDNGTGVIKATPGLNPNFPAVVCPLLGGNVA